jgi:hypothetical protein
MSESTAKKYPHYYKRVPLDPNTGNGHTHLDIYQVLEMWDVFSPAAQHAVKKIFCAGERGAKDMRKDINEAIISLQRQLEMLDSRELTQKEFPEDT